jgi:hypothetical protein
MSEKLKITQPTLMTHKKMIGSIYMGVVNQTLEYLTQDFNLDKEGSKALKDFIHETKNLEKILAKNTPKKIRNSLINKGEKTEPSNT